MTRPIEPISTQRTLPMSPTTSCLSGRDLRADVGVFKELDAETFGRRE